MNPIDSNVSVRTPRSDGDQGTRRSGAVDSGGAARGASASAGARSSSGESVSFTRAAEELLQLESQLRELPGIDQVRVDSIREAIGNGSYQIDAQRIVDSLLQSESELR